MVGVSFEAIRERSQTAGGLSETQSTKQASAASGSSASAEMGISYCAGTCDTAVTFTVENVHTTSTPALTQTLLQTLHPDWSVPLRLGTLSGEFISNSATKHAAFVWQIGQWSYSAQTVGIDTGEFLRIVAGLQLA